MKDYYKILDVDRGASQADIQKAFRKLAHKYHPDKKGGDVNKFKEINEAYQVLNNEQKRAQYDAGGFADPGGAGAGAGFNGAQGFGGFDFSNVDFSGGGSAAGFGDIFGSIFRNAMNRGADVQVDIRISFEESVFGTKKKITVPYRRKKTETIEIPIPAGVQHGTTFHIPGKGEPSGDGKGQPGDMYVQVAVEESDVFERHGGDLVRRLSLTPTEALLGTKKEIRDVRGEKINVVVPEASKEGTPIVVQGKGIPRPAGTDRLVVLCHIVYPKRMSNKARELLGELKKEGW